MLGLFGDTSADQIKSFLDHGGTVGVAKPVELQHLLSLMQRVQLSRPVPARDGSPPVFPERPAAPGNVEENETSFFLELLRLALQAMSEHPVHARDSRFRQICEELRESALSFGRLHTASQLAKLTHAIEFGSDQDLERCWRSFEQTATRDIQTGAQNPPAGERSNTLPLAEGKRRAGKDRGVRFNTESPIHGQIVSEFLMTLKSKLDTMRACCHRGDLEQLSRIADWLGDTGGTLGFEEFAIPATRLQQAAAARASTEAKKQIEFIAELFQRIEPGLSPETPGRIHHE